MLLGIPGLLVNVWLQLFIIGIVWFDYICYGREPSVPSSSSLCVCVCATPYSTEPYAIEIECVHVCSKVHYCGRLVSCELLVMREEGGV